MPGPGRTLYEHGGKRWKIRESDLLSLFLRSIDDLPKKIQVEIEEGGVVMSESDGVIAWIKACIRPDHPLIHHSGTPCGIGIQPLRCRTINRYIECCAPSA